MTNPFGSYPYQRDPVTGLSSAQPSRMTQFQVGMSYATRSICDHDCIFSFTIHARTAKTVTVDVHARRVRRGLSTNWNGTAEAFSPFGKYSMSAVISADKPAGERAR